MVAAAEPTAGDVGEPEGRSEPPDTGQRSPRRCSVDTVVLLLTLAWGAGIASYPLADNSFLTHLATGRLILDRGSVPSSDPYSFTASGTDWTVQSWLASMAYAGAERAGGAVGLHLLVIAVFLAAAGLIWRLSRPCVSLVPRVALIFGSLYVVTDLWGERPYMTGVIGLALVWLALEGSVRPWMLIPIFWVWANTHGSFPLGVALIVAVLIGAWWDGDDLGTIRRVLAFAAGGTLSAAIGPLGLRVLLFPFTALTKSDVLSEVVEWRPAAYDTLGQRLFLLLVVVAVIGLVRRPSWRLAIPSVLFIVGAIVAQRNIVMAVMVLVPVVASTMPSFGSLTVHQRPGLLRAYVGVGAVAVVLAVVYAASSPFGSLEQYPVRPLAWLGDGAVDRPTATQDIVGNLLTALDGENAAVFVDDRVDMYPAEVVYDSLTLLRAEPGWATVLDRYDIDHVVWERSKPLGAVLAADSRWQIIFTDTDWFVACRRGVSCDR